MGDRLRPLWDFNDLDASEQRFRAQLEQEGSDEGRAEVLTQLARVQGLRDLFAEGDRLIDQASAIAGSSETARIRIQLERGRLRRSSGDVAGALPLFESAYDIARQAGEQFLAADSAHMAALAAPDRTAMLAWTEKGTRIAAASSDPTVSYWLGPLLNNLGSAYMDSGEYDKALDSFQRALEVRKRYPENPEAIQFAKDAVIEALTALGRLDEAARV
jgi:tetratricopeptide (TPR) repeat protein